MFSFQQRRLPPNHLARNFTERSCPAHFHRILEFSPQFINKAAYAFLAAAINSIDKRSGNKDGIGAQGKSLETSTPVRIPPSTKILTLPPTAAAISGRTSAVAGLWSRTRPPWLETTIAAAPAWAALTAPLTLMMPLTMKGTSVRAMISFISSTDLLPAGGTNF